MPAPGGGRGCRRGRRRRRGEGGRRGVPPAPGPARPGLPRPAARRLPGAGHRRGDGSSFCRRRRRRAPRPGAGAAAAPAEPRHEVSGAGPRGGRGEAGAAGGTCGKAAAPMSAPSEGEWGFSPFYFLILFVCSSPPPNFSRAAAPARQLGLVRPPRLSHSARDGRLGPVQPALTSGTKSPRSWVRGGGLHLSAVGVVPCGGRGTAARHGTARGAGFRLGNSCGLASVPTAPLSALAPAGSRTAAPFPSVSHPSPAGQQRAAVRRWLPGGRAFLILGEEAFTGTFFFFF